jgi:hypothetical protein
MHWKIRKRQAAFHHAALDAIAGQRSNGEDRRPRFRMIIELMLDPHEYYE